MRPLILSACLLAFAAAPACAQFVGKHDYGPVGISNPFIGDSRQPGPGIGRELRGVRQQINEARESGALTGREARQLRREAWAIEQLAARYADDGLSRSEQDELENRTHYLSDAVKRPR
jgi:uncharacterized membrane protein